MTLTNFIIVYKFPEVCGCEEFIWKLNSIPIHLFSHLIRLVDVEDQPRRLADDEDDHDGEEEGGHGLVPPVAGAQRVVKGRVAAKCDLMISKSHYFLHDAKVC